MTNQPKQNSEKTIANNNNNKSNIKQPKKNLDSKIELIKLKGNIKQPKKNLDSKIELIKLTVELVKAIAWPLFATLAFLSFWGPLRLTVRQLPELVSRSETITVAGLSIKVQSGLSQQVSDEVKQSVAQLSPEAISTLLTMQGSVYYPLESANFGITRYAELIELGLVAQLSEEELTTSSSDRQYEFGVKITSLGTEAQSFLLSLISEFTRELPSAEQ